MKIVAIGWISQMTVYIGLDRDDAMRRYDQENPGCTIKENNLPVKEMEVKDSFKAYDIWVDDSFSI